ncbi:MAG: hypothetical protein IPL31_04255 [Saprospiraceae bacterium]|nr:hypothetical protein [Saprospiraceae bacterium]
MKSILIQLQPTFSGILLLLNIMFFNTCNSPQKSEVHIAKSSDKQNVNLHKPPSTFQDSLIINTAAAVFYLPDTIQLKKIKSITNPQIFDGSMHEYILQQRNAHTELKNKLPNLKLIDSENNRYLVFTNPSKNQYIIDLDQYDDAYGMFIYDIGKAPIFVDMTNLETTLYPYFNK